MRMILALLCIFLSTIRDYQAPVTPVEKKGISYVIRTLSEKNILLLKPLENRLKEEGNKADGVHPLRWFEVILTDERLKAAMVNLIRKDYVYGQFMKDMGKSFDLALERNNLTQEQLQDFSRKIGVDIALLQPPFDERNWKEFVSVAVVNVPRSGDHGRYDM